MEGIYKVTNKPTCKPEITETPVLFMQPYRPRGNLRGKTETRKPRDVNVNFLERR